MRPGLTRTKQLGRFRPRLETLEDRSLPSGLDLSALSAPDPATQARVSSVYGQLPLAFEANARQTDAAVRFLSRGAGYTLFLTDQGAVVSLPGQGSAPGAFLRITFPGANPNPQVIGADPQAGVTNYLIGRDAAGWHTGVANYARVLYHGLYPGVDVAFYGNRQELEWDFVVSPGASPAAVRTAIDRAGAPTLDAAGNLVFHTALGDVVNRAPVAYQSPASAQTPVPARYVLEAGGQVGLALGSYDPARPLVIDPVFAYDTFPGSDTVSAVDTAYGIAVDQFGNA